MPYVQWKANLPRLSGSACLRLFPAGSCREFQCGCNFSRTPSLLIPRSAMLPSPREFRQVEAMLLLEQVGHLARTLWNADATCLYLQSCHRSGGLFWSKVTMISSHGSTGSMSCPRYLMMMMTLALGHKSLPLWAPVVRLWPTPATILVQKQKTEMIRACCLARLMAHLSDRQCLIACDLRQYSYYRS